MFKLLMSIWVRGLSRRESRVVFDEVGIIKESICVFVYKFGKVSCWFSDIYYVSFIFKFIVVSFLVK